MQLLVDIVHNNFQYGRCVNAHPQTHRVMLEALPYLENRSLILAPNIRKRERFFCLLAGMVFEQKVSGWNSLWSSTNLVQKCLSGAVNCKFECVWMFLRSSFSISELFHVPLDVACLSCFGDIKTIPAAFTIASYPGPFENRRKGPGIHCSRMRLISE